MGVLRTERVVRRRHVDWWVLGAWLSLTLLVLAGLAAAAGVGV